ncbi:MAG: cytochrome c biogenesis protein CcsA [Verrucomicrobiales bacterium]
MISTLCFFGGFAHALLALRAGKYLRRWWKMPLMIAGFALQSAFLYLRGAEHGRCPITNLFEILIFVGWSAALLYFMIGSVYRLSLLGMFTAPLVFIFQAVALAMPALDKPTAKAAPGTVDPWLEMHASVSLLAYGAFAMTVRTAIMYLLQDRQLKKRNLKTLFYALPPINYLGKANFRLIAFGFTLLTLGIASAYFMKEKPGGLKLALTWAVWALYAGVLISSVLRSYSPRRIAAASALAFLLPVITLGVISGKPHPPENPPVSQP